MKRVLIVEPYYGGSHRFFLEGLRNHVPADYTLLTLPARKWKMRMQLAAPWCIQQIKALPHGERRFDTILCSSFVDVAVLRALLIKVKGWNPGATVCTYFHENQLVYPQRYGDPDCFQFAAINFYSALASDKIAFNSAYNEETFFRGCQRYLQAASEMGVSGIIDELRQKSRILYPGIDFSAIDRQRSRPDSGPPVIVWNHRWEHDKNPDGFFQALMELSRQRIDFRLIVLGKTFADSPPCFARARNNLRSNIVHFGYADRYCEYLALLSRGDLVVSTALHEFFGIAVIEAVRAGCVPLLPRRLSYPELFSEVYLYREEELSEKLKQAAAHRRRLNSATARVLTERFSWPHLAADYCQWLLEERLEVGKSY